MFFIQSHWSRPADAGRPHGGYTSAGVLALACRAVAESYLTLYPDAQAEWWTDTRSLDNLTDAAPDRVTVRRLLDKIEEPAWLFMSGKVEVYRRAPIPFFHVDNDYLIRKPLPTDAPVIVSNAEEGAAWARTYQRAIAALRAASVEIPAAWDAAAAAGRAWNMGVIGFNSEQVLGEYLFRLEDAYKVVERIIDAGLDRRPPYPEFLSGVCCLIEQATLSAVLIDLRVTPATQSAVRAYNPVEAMRARQEGAMIHGFGSAGKLQFEGYLRDAVHRPHPADDR